MARRITPLKRAIFESGRTQRDIAAAVGLSEKQISQISNGLHANERTQELLAAELGQTVEDLFPLGEAA